MNRLAIPVLIEQIKWKHLTIALAGSIALPVLIHLLPIQPQVPLGAKLLPIFYAPLVAVLLSRPHVGLLVALLAPSMNYFITGMPAWELVPVLTIELIIFAGLVAIFKSNKLLVWVAGPLGYILAKGLSGALIWMMPFINPNVIPGDFVSVSISNGFTGIIALLVIGVLAVLVSKRNG